MSRFIAGIVVGIAATIGASALLDKAFEGTYLARSRTGS